VRNRRKRAGFPDGREPRKFFQSPTNVTNSKMVRRCCWKAERRARFLSFNNRTVALHGAGVEIR